MGMQRAGDEPARVVRVSFEIKIADVLGVIQRIHVCRWELVNVCKRPATRTHARRDIGDG